MKDVSAIAGDKLMRRYDAVIGNMVCIRIKLDRLQKKTDPRSRDRACCLQFQLSAAGLGARRLEDQIWQQMLHA